MLDERRVVSQPDSVRVDHHDIDRLGAGVFENLEELGMDRRLAAGKLQHFGPRFDLHEPIDGPAAFVDRQMLLARPASRITNRASQIASRRDLDQPDARVLLVLGAKSAIQRAALIRLDAKQRRLARQAEFHPIELRNIGANKILADPMRRAALAKINPRLVLHDDLRRHDGQTFGTQTLRHSQKAMFAKLHDSILGSPNVSNQKVRQKTEEHGSGDECGNCQNVIAGPAEPGAVMNPAVQVTKKAAKAAMKLPHAIHVANANETPNAAIFSGTVSGWPDRRSRFAAIAVACNAAGIAKTPSAIPNPGASRTTPITTATNAVHRNKVLRLNVHFKSAGFSAGGAYGFAFEGPSSLGRTRTGSPSFQPQSQQ